MLPAEGAVGKRAPVAEEGADDHPSTSSRKLAYVVPISLRYPRPEGTTNFRRPRESGDLGRPNE